MNRNAKKPLRNFRPRSSLLCSGVHFVKPKTDAALSAGQMALGRRDRPFSCRVLVRNPACNCEEIPLRFLHLQWRIEMALSVRSQRKSAENSFAKMDCCWWWNV